MSTSKLFSYKMKKGQWAEADALTESDIAVIIDVSSEIFWFWEGSHSTARDRYNARQILGQLRERYMSYKFKRINKQASEDVKDKLEMLQIHALAKKKSDKITLLKNLSNIIYSMNLINILFIVISIILLIGIFFQSQAVFPDIFINQSNFISIIEICSLFILLSFIFLILSAIYTGILRKRLLMVISIVGCCLAFIPFFMLRIWDELLIYITSSQQIIIQIDALIFYLFSIVIFLVLDITCCLTVGIMGLINVTILIRRHKKETDYK